MRGEVKRLGGVLDHVRCIGAVHAGWVSWREAAWGRCWCWGGGP
jgi:hypothetical protein